MDSTWKAFYEDGGLCIYQYRKNGLLNGISFSLYPNGDTAYVNFHEGGYKSGRWIHYNEDGQVRNITEYDAGTTREYSGEEYCTEYHYKNGVLYLKKRIENGVLVNEENINNAIASEVNDAKTGKSIFFANCAACHSLTKDATGPNLKGVATKRPASWLRSFIINGDSLYASGDALATELYRRWNKTRHPKNQHLNDQELELLLSYLKEN